MLRFLLGPMLIKTFAELERVALGGTALGEVKAGTTYQQFMELAKSRAAQAGVEKPRLLLAMKLLQYGRHLTPEIEASVKSGKLETFYVWNEIILEAKELTWEELVTSWGPKRLMENPTAWVVDGKKYTIL